MHAIWFVLGSMVGATVAFFLFALLSRGSDDRCAKAADWSSSNATEQEWYTSPI